MTRQKNKWMGYLLFACGAVGWGLSSIDWGDPEGVHGIGWPVPVSIQRVSEDAPVMVEMIADLGIIGMFLNVLLTMLAGVFLWAIGALIIRVFRGA